MLVLYNKIIDVFFKAPSKS